MATNQIKRDPTIYDIIRKGWAKDVASYLNGFQLRGANGIQTRKTGDGWNITFNGPPQSPMRIAVVTGVIPACDDSDPSNPLFFSGDAQLQKIDYTTTPATTTPDTDINVYSIESSDIDVGTVIEVQKDNNGQWWAIPPEGLTISFCTLAEATSSSFATLGTVNVTCGTKSMTVANPMHLQGDINAPVTLVFTTGIGWYLSAIAQEYQRRQFTIGGSSPPGTPSGSLTDPNKHGMVQGQSGFATFWLGAWVWEGGGCV